MKMQKTVIFAKKKKKKKKLKINIWKIKNIKKLDTIVIIHLKYNAPKNFLSFYHKRVSKRI